MKIKTLSVRQPWAWALFHGKPVENRTWFTDHRGLTLIHASKTFDHQGYQWILDNENILGLDEPMPAIKDFKLGGIVGAADLIKTCRQHLSPWFFGPWGFVFEGAYELPFMACRGQLGFFEVEYTNKAGG